MYSLLPDSRIDSRCTFAFPFSWYLARSLNSNNYGKNNTTSWLLLCAKHRTKHLHITLVYPNDHLPPPILQKTKLRPERLNKYNDYLMEHLVWTPWRKTVLSLSGQGVSDLQSPQRAAAAHRCHPMVASTLWNREPGVSWLSSPCGLAGSL